MNRLSVAATAFALFWAPVCSDSAYAERRVALVIGNSAYQNAPPLANPMKDAQTIAAMLRKGGFAVVAAHYDVGNLQFKRAVRQFEDAATDADVAVVFYAGHGLEIRGTNYMIPIDAKLANDRDADDEAITLDRLVASTEDAKQLGLVILDACRDNPFARQMKRARTAALRGIAAGLGIVEPPNRNTLIAYAAKSGFAAQDGDREHSPFTAALLKYLFEPGLDIRIAFGRVRDDVLKSTGNKQEPFVTGSLGGGHIALVPAAESQTAALPDLAVQRSDYNLAKEVGTKGVWESFIIEHPTGFFADLARLQIAKLTAAGQEAAAAERARIEREQAERARLEHAERERVERERVAREQAERERLEKERLASEQAERARLERERIAREQAERAEREEQARIDAERQRLAREQAERLEKERLAREETERLARERVAKEAAERAQLEQAERERAQEQARLEAERNAREQAEREQAARTQTALLTPPAAPAGALPAASLEDSSVIREIKRELRRVGCYSGSLDETWPSGQAAAQRFLRLSRGAVPATSPTIELLDAIREKSGRVCPLECSARQVERDGRCVTKLCPAGFVLNDRGGCERSRERSASLPGQSKATAARPGPTPRTKSGEKDWNQIAINCKAQATAAHGETGRRFGGGRGRRRGAGPGFNLTGGGRQAFRNCYRGHGGAL